ncbi:unnamed protein product [Durusdinium trenchii]|uniref:Uncharacterized protein n=1 Tax=Durusdinium trenchii TaxID=1381693 RepID=A0ABP0N809_9DINO
MILPPAAGTPGVAVAQSKWEPVRDLAGPRDSSAVIVGSAMKGGMSLTSPGQAASSMDPNAQLLFAPRRSLEQRRGEQLADAAVTPQFFVEQTRAVMSALPSQSAPRVQRPSTMTITPATAEPGEGACVVRFGTETVDRRHERLMPNLFSRGSSECCLDGVNYWSRLPRPARELERWWVQRRRCMASSQRSKRKFRYGEERMYSSSLDEGLMAFIAGSLDGLNGPPTPFALRMRPWLIFVFGSLGLVGLARLALLDVTGGLFLVLAVLIGYMAIRKGMNIAWLLCLAMILFLNAILDGFLVLALGLRTQWDFFFQKQPWYMFLGRLLTFVGPILEMLGAYLSWSVYKDHMEHLPSSEAFLLSDAEQVSYQSTETVATRHRDLGSHDAWKDG